jgi:hypothetical protein
VLDEPALFLCLHGVCFYTKPGSGSLLAVTDESKCRKRYASLL